MSSVAGTRTHAPEFSDFALMPGSGVLEGLDAAGIDGRLVAGPDAFESPASADDSSAFVA